MPAVLLALEAAVSLRSPNGDRVVRLADFFVGPFMTALRAQELITDVVVPLSELGSGSAYVSVEHPASGFALAGAAASVGPDGERVAVTGIAGRPFLVSDHGDPVGDTEVFGDRFAPADYRRGLAIVLVERALERAKERAVEDR
jgi:CO/xanthine dehydrogenase FAD-binding subunit